MVIIKCSPPKLILYSVLSQIQLTVVLFILTLKIHLNVFLIKESRPLAGTNSDDEMNFFMQTWASESDISRSRQNTELSQTIMNLPT